MVDGWWAVAQTDEWTDRQTLGKLTRLSIRCLINVISSLYRRHWLAIQQKKTETMSEPRYDKNNTMSVRPKKPQISLGISPVRSVFAVRMKKACVLSYPLSAQRRLWSDWAEGWFESSQGAQSLCWFCHVAAHLFALMYLNIREFLVTNHY